MFDKYVYLTTPIYYVNALPHLGHAYTTVLADTLSRYFRLAGCHTFFMTGTDEHGDKIQRAAESNGETPEHYVDRVSGVFRKTWDRMGISYDNFIRTTDSYHIHCVQEILKAVYLKGDIYFGEYGGHYCTGCERFYTEKEWDDLGGRYFCPDHKTELEEIREKNYFFKMESYRGWLVDQITSNPGMIRPERYRNEILSYLGEPVGDLCISRPRSRLTWGIPLPFDQNYVTYVWFDALINYISGLGWPDGQNFHRFWKGAHHLIAKDILKPHAVYWPMMLHSAGIPVYRSLNVHGYWLMDKDKMSKSLDNIVRPLEMQEKYGSCAFRYYLLREMTFGLDASYSEENLVGRLNSDLANDWGNLVSRVVSMIKRYFDGRVPNPGPDEVTDRELLVSAGTLPRVIDPLMREFATSRALEEIWRVIRSCNQYVDQQAPWTLKKQGDDERLATVLYTLVEAIRRIAVTLLPFLPESSEKVLDTLGIIYDGSKSYEILLAEAGNIAPGTKVAGSIILFEKVEVRR